MRIARHAVGLVALAVALVPPTSAAAQSGDPAEASPSGVIYEIPLDNARQDAAPTRKRGVGGSGGNGGTSGSGAQGGIVSPIRSENGFGSSSIVPGASAGKAAASGAGSGASKSGGAGGSGAGGNGSGGSGADGQGSGGSGAGGSGSGAGGNGSGGAAAPGASTEGTGGTRSASITPSKSRAYLLLTLALAVAGGLGIAGRYVARRR